MAGTNRQTPDHLIEQLANNPLAFDFFRAVRLLECQHPNQPRMGYSLSPAQDPIRFCQNPSLAFASSTIEALQRTAPDAVPKLFVRFFGLLGPNAPLPPHLTEYAYERRLHHDDNTLTAFLNVFHHRLIAFFYRAWSASQLALDLDRPDHQRFTTFLGSLIGLGMESLRGRDPVQDWAKFYFAGRFGAQTRNAEGLEAVLQQYFSVPSEVQSFVGRWLDLPADSTCQLGASPDTGSLGLTTILGSRFWDCQLSFRIRIGPVNLVDYERMLPSGDSFQRLKYLILNYCGEHFFWDVHLVLEASQVPETVLGQAGRLGWTSWLKTAPFSRDADDLILDPSDN